MSLVVWGVGAILENRYGIQGQNYVSQPRGSKMTAVFHFRNLMLGISFILITLNVISSLMVSKSKFKSCRPRSFPRMGKYEFSSQC